MRKKNRFSGQKKGRRTKNSASAPLCRFAYPPRAGAFYVRSAGAAGCGSAGSAFHASTTFSKSTVRKGGSEKLRLSDPSALCRHRRHRLMPFKPYGMSSPYRAAVSAVTTISTVLRPGRSHSAATKRYGGHNAAPAKQPLI